MTEIRELPGFEVYEFRAPTQVELLAKISEWLASEEQGHPTLSLIRFDFDEVDLEAGLHRCSVYAEFAAALR